MKRRRLLISKPKRKREMQHTEKAARIIGNVLKDMVSPFGRSERDVAAEIRRRIRQQGASMSFMPIVASGRNSGHVHHKPGDKIVREEEPVIFDLGAKYRGMCSDITRMHIPDDRKFRKMFRDILKMQDTLISKTRKGAELRKLQEVYCTLMEKKGYKVKHMIGHGLGRNVHERIKGPLVEKIVLTIEPGVYIRDFGGCRIEDMIAVEKNGPRVISDFIPKAV